MAGTLARINLKASQPVLQSQVTREISALSQIGPDARIFPRGSLRSDQSVQGDLASGAHREEWTFVGGEDDTISLTLVSDAQADTDVTIWAQDSEAWIDTKKAVEGQQIRYSARLPYDGVYVVTVTPHPFFQTGKGGAYCLIMTTNRPASTCILKASHEA